MAKWGVYVGCLDGSFENLVKDFDTKKEAVRYEQDFECDIDEYTEVRMIE